MIGKCVRIVLVATLGAVLGWAQAAPPPPPPPAPPSLGDAARKARTQKTGKSKLVFTNDNMPQSKEPTPPEPAAADPKAATPAAGAEKKEPAADKKDAAQEEKEWRAKFAKQRENLEYEERKLDVLQRELNLAQIQNYSDPNQALREQFARTELAKRTTELDGQKQRVDAAKKAIADLEGELRKKSLPAGWAR